MREMRSLMTMHGPAARMQVAFANAGLGERQVRLRHKVARRDAARGAMAEDQPGVCPIGGMQMRVRPPVWSIHVDQRHGPRR
jgi:hypothetical protein